ncbi:UDP-2,3-diacylglucosamine diphosphatase [Roseovarius sp. D22-M7]|uniref:UDP-2,3-diacylglucosamine diphosphatase n=1 Tax=Roseovarius sp. D22-M7 TaxID=3127116 RepID=UPI0030102876
MSKPYANGTQAGYDRTLFVSDLHLGARGCKAREILEFLKSCHAETVYLVGDIFDFWHVGKVHWTGIHDEIVVELNRFSQSGARLIYLVGNHDRKAQHVVQAYLPYAEFRVSTVHQAADDRTYLVLHGDQADRRLLRWHIMTLLGSRVDANLRAIDDWITRNQNIPADHPGIFRQLISLFNRMMAMGERFETLLASMAKEAGTDGVICGHSHRPGVRVHNDTTYANCGDWVDSLTALTEDHNGHIELYSWQREPRRAQQPERAKRLSAPLVSDKRRRA